MYDLCGIHTCTVCKCILTCHISCTYMYSVQVYLDQSCCMYIHVQCASVSWPVMFHVHTCTVCKCILTSHVACTYMYSVQVYLDQSCFMYIHVQCASVSWPVIFHVYIHVQCASVSWPVIFHVHTCTVCKCILASHIACTVCKCILTSHIACTYMYSVQVYLGQSYFMYIHVQCASVSWPVIFHVHTCTVCKCILTSHTACTCSFVSQTQTRSADELMTTFVYCNEYGNRWKVRCQWCHVMSCGVTTYDSDNDLILLLIFPQFCWSHEAETRTDCNIGCTLIYSLLCLMYTIIHLHCLFMCAVNFFTDLIDVHHPSDSFLTFRFVRTFNISVCKNQIMYACTQNIMQCALETDCFAPQHY